MLSKELVQSQVDIVKVLEGAGVTLKQQGDSDNFMGLCPFHPDRNPSLSVNRAKKLFHCFGCGTGGDIFKFVMLIEKVSFPEAVQILAGLYKIQTKKR